MHIQGEPIRGHLHSIDASSGVAVPLFNPGELVARTLLANEYIEIHQIELVSDAGGDCHVFLGADATLGTGEIVLRGTFGANGGLEKMSNILRAGAMGHTVWVDAPIGVVDVTFQGTIRGGGDGTSVRPTWKEDTK